MKRSSSMFDLKSSQISNKIAELDPVYAEYLVFMGFYFRLGRFIYRIRSWLLVGMWGKLVGRGLLR